MKHFIIKINYTAPIEKIDEILPKHRAFLQTGYDKNMLLFSGPINPRTGGFVVAKAKSLEEMKDFFNNDPYKINKCAEYEFYEFNPVKHQNFLRNWIEE
jgi:uncharacterized protein YciI